MKKILINIKFIIKESFKWTINFFSILGIISLFVSFTDLLLCFKNLPLKILIATGIILLIWFIMFLIRSLIFFKTKSLKIFETKNDHYIYIEYGDILLYPKDIEEKINIVIPVNRCFDTKIDDNLISSNTLHGKIFKKIYETGEYDENSLNQALQDNLSQQKIKPDILKADDKKSGNLKRYPVGSISELSLLNNCTYFFLGLSCINSNLKAETSIHDYEIAIAKLIEYCTSRSQQYPVIIPLIGAGLSKTTLEERDILEYLVKSLKINKNFINYDVYIIVRSSGKKIISITNL